MEFHINESIYQENTFLNYMTLHVGLSQKQWPVPHFFRIISLFINFYKIRIFKPGSKSIHESHFPSHVEFNIGHRLFC